MTVTRQMLRKPASVVRISSTARLMGKTTGSFHHVALAEQDVAFAENGTAQKARRTQARKQMFLAAELGVLFGISEGDAMAVEQSHF
jgi:hypothetical protein